MFEHPWISRSSSSMGRKTKQFRWSRRHGSKKSSPPLACAAQKLRYAAFFVFDRFWHFISTDHIFVLISQSCFRLLFFNNYSYSLCETQILDGQSHTDPIVEHPMLGVDPMAAEILKVLRPGRHCTVLPPLASKFTVNLIGICMPF